MMIGCMQLLTARCQWQQEVEMIITMAYRYMTNVLGDRQDEASVIDIGLQSANLAWTGKGESGYAF